MIEIGSIWELFGRNPTNSVIVIVIYTTPETVFIRFLYNHAGAIRPGHVTAMECMDMFLKYYREVTYD